MNSSQLTLLLHVYKVNASDFIHKIRLHNLYLRHKLRFISAFSHTQNIFVDSAAKNCDYLSKLYDKSGLHSTMQTIKNGGFTSFSG